MLPRIESSNLHFLGRRGYFSFLFPDLSKALNHLLSNNQMISLKLFYLEYNHFFYVNQIYLHSFCRGLVKLFQHLRLFDHYSFRYCDLHWLFIGLIRDFWVFLAMKLYVSLSTLKHSYFHPHFHLNSSHHFSLGDKEFDKIIGWLFLRFIVYSFFKYLELFFDFPLQAYLFFPDTFDKTQKTSFLLVRNYIFKVPLYEKR